MILASYCLFKFVANRIKQRKEEDYCLEDRANSESGSGFIFRFI